MLAVMKKKVSGDPNGWRALTSQHPPPQALTAQPVSELAPVSPSSEAGLGPLGEEILAKLRDTLEPTHIELRDDSVAHGGEPDVTFTLSVSAPHLAPLNQAQRDMVIRTVIGDQIPRVKKLVIV